MLNEVSHSKRKYMMNVRAHTGIIVGNKAFHDLALWEVVPGVEAFFYSQKRKLSTGMSILREKLPAKPYLNILRSFTTAVEFKNVWAIFPQFNFSVDAPCFQGTVFAAACWGHFI
ncbi:hypothetical protein [Caproicibacterium lactatifermentans]|uniref:hypothetical protein n=1 Tax=Caproicibacterium lactatifermentans TaxID=2666138 RepID=UPI003D92C47F